MGTKTGIAWTDSTWNPITGCSKVSPGCANCYAETLSLRMGWSKKPWTPENAAQNVVLHHDRLQQPLRWKDGRLIFVNSMSDLFHELVPYSFINQVFAVMALAPQHIFQVLTKRPERMLAYMTTSHREHRVMDASVDTDEMKAARTFQAEWPLPNVALGVSVENQHWADERKPLLLETPAAYRFLSCEPLLGPVDLRLRDMYCETADKAGLAPHTIYDSQAGWLRPYCQAPLHWIIVGGESGKSFRAMDPQWARDIHTQCQDAQIPFFFKQSSALRPGQGTELDGVVYHEYPPEWVKHLGWDKAA